MLAPGAVLLVVPILLDGKMMAIVPVKYVIAFDGLALGGALIYSMNLVPDLKFKSLVILRATQTIGLAFLFVPIRMIAYPTLPLKFNGNATALFSMARNVCGGIGISVSTALIIEHQQICQAHLGEHLTPVNQHYNDLPQHIQQTLIASGQSAGRRSRTRPARSSRSCRTSSPYSPTPMSS